MSRVKARVRVRVRVRVNDTWVLQFYKRLAGQWTYDYTIHSMMTRSMYVRRWNDHHVPCVQKHSRTANMTCHRVVMTLLSGIELPSLRFCNFKNNGGFAFETFGLALRSIAFVTPWLGLQIPARLKVCSHLCTQAKPHWTLVDESWRVDFCQIHGTHLQAIQDPSTSRSLESCCHWSTAIQLHENRLLPRDLVEVAGFHASDPSWAPAWPSSWPGVPAHLACRVSGLVCAQIWVATEHGLRCQQPQTRTRQVFPPASRRLAVPQVRDRPHLLSYDRCPVHFNLKFHISCAFVNLQTFVTFRIMLHLLFGHSSVWVFAVFPWTAMSEHAAQPIDTPSFLQSAFVT